jgi:hypothetical protein
MLTGLGLGTQLGACIFCLKRRASRGEACGGRGDSLDEGFLSGWPKLRAGYLLDALDGLDGPSTPFTAIPMYLRWVDEAEAARQPSAGLGEDVRLRGEHVIGSGLELDSELIQLSAFSSRDGGRRAFGRIARPSHRH